MNRGLGKSLSQWNRIVLLCFLQDHTLATNSLQWRHNERNGISNHQPHDCLLKRLFSHRSKKTSKLHVTGLCEGNSLVTGEYPAQRASNTENVSIWWCHHESSITNSPLPTNHFKIAWSYWKDSLSGVPDFFARNKILSGYDLSHYQVPHCIRVFFYFVWFVFIHHNFQFYCKLCTYCNILDINLS